MKIVLKVLSLVPSGEPAGTRTQGPRLKSSNEGVLTRACYGNGFPTFIAISATYSFLLVPVRSICSLTFYRVLTQICHNSLIMAYRRKTKDSNPCLSLEKTDQTEENQQDEHSEPSNE